MPQPTSPPTAPELFFPDAREALEGLRQTLMSIPAERVEPARVHVPTAVANLLQIARSFAEDGARMEEVFTDEGFDAGRFDDLPDRAQAFWQADVELRIALDPKRTLPPLLEQGGALRRALLDAAIYLWGRDPDLGPRVAEIRSGIGHLDLADDLMALSSMIADHWEAARGRCRVEEQELVEARTVATKILSVLRASEGEAETVALRDLRNRAASYAREAADEIRAAAAFVHRHAADPLEGYPSIYAGKRPRKSEEAAPEAPAPPAEVPVS